LFSNDFIRDLSILSTSPISLASSDRLLLPYKSPDIVDRTFAKPLILYNFSALSADGCALRLEKIHFVSLESWNPGTLES